METGCGRNRPRTRKIIPGSPISKRGGSAHARHDHESDNRRASRLVPTQARLVSGGTGRPHRAHRGLAREDREQPDRTGPSVGHQVARRRLGRLARRPPRGAIAGRLERGQRHGDRAGSANRAHGVPSAHLTRHPEPGSGASEPGRVENGSRQALGGIPGIPIRVRHRPTSRAPSSGAGSRRRPRRPRPGRSPGSPRTDLSAGRYPAHEAG